MFAFIHKFKLSSNLLFLLITTCFANSVFSQSDAVTSIQPSVTTQQPTTQLLESTIQPNATIDLTSSPLTAIPSTTVLSPSPTPPDPEPTTPEPFASTVVEPGSAEHDYAIDYCKGESFDSVYLLNPGADFTGAVFQRLPLGETLFFHGQESSDRKKRQASSTTPLLTTAPLETFLSFSLTPLTRSELLLSDIERSNQLLSLEDMDELIDQQSIRAQCSESTLLKQFTLTPPNCALQQSSERRPISATAHSEIRSRIAEVMETNPHLTASATLPGSLFSQLLLSLLDAASYLQLNEQLLALPSTINDVSTPEPPVANILLLMDSSVEHTPRVLPHFTFAQNVRIGFCGLDKTLLNAASGSGSSSSSGSGATQTEPQQAVFNVQYRSDAIFPTPPETRVYSFFHLQNAEIVFMHMHINGEPWHSGLYPIRPDYGKFIGHHVRITKNSAVNQGTRNAANGFIQSAGTEFIFNENSQLEYSLDTVGLFLILTGSISLEDTHFKLRGDETTGISAWLDFTASFDNVTFESTDPDTSPVAYEGVITHGQTLTLKNSRFIGPWNPAIRISRNTITPDSINNDYSQASGPRCSVFNHESGMVLFTDGIACPSIATEPPTNPPTTNPPTTNPPTTNPPTTTNSPATSTAAETQPTTTTMHSGATSNYFISTLIFIIPIAISAIFGL